MTIVNVFYRQLNRRTHRLSGITHVMVRFVLRLQAVDNLHRLFHRRFGDIDLLETTGQRTIFLKDVAELLVGGGADHPDLAAGKQRFNQVSRIDLAARSRPRTDNGVDFINKQDAVGILLQLFEQRFEAFFKIATIFGPCQQRANVERVDGAVGHHFRHIALHNAPGKAFGDRSFTDAGFTHQQWVIFTATAQDLNRTLQLFFTADQGINAADASKLIEVGGEVFHTFLPAGLLFIARLASAVIGRLARLVFACTMRNEVHHIESADFMFTQQVSGLRLLLAENGHQYVGAGHFAAARRLHVEDGALQHTLEAQRRLGVALFFRGWQDGCGLFDEGFKFLTQCHQVH